MTKANTPLAAPMLALLLLVGACSGTTPPKPDESQVRLFTGKGYLTDDQYSITTHPLSWKVGDQFMDLLLSLPSRPGKYPLVLYVPGLGENREAGEAWRTAWARAGYGVITLQPLDKDGRAWSSPQALAGDFTHLARERYAGPAMGQRLERLALLLAELKQRQQQGDPLLASLDTDQVALAGYDLGAYTAMAAAGEKLKAMPDPTHPLPIRAAIALSPYASFNGLAFTARYPNIRLPVLSVTGDQDGDALGLLDSPSLRQAPFHYMPKGDKYLLVLQDMPHPLYSGGPLGRGQETQGRGSKAGDTGSAGMGEGPEGGMGQGPGGGIEGGPSGGRGGMGKHGGQRAGAGRDASDQDGHQNLTRQALAVAAIQGVSTAFLDAYLKQDDTAREWLARDSNRWLKQQGRLDRK